MKELIEIPDSNVIANTEGCFGINFDGMDYQKIIMGGTPIPDNVTNGGIIKVMFPNEIFKEISEYIEGQQVVSIFGKKSCMCFDVDWWNAPYKRGNEK